MVFTGILNKKIINYMAEWFGQKELMYYFAAFKNE